MDAREVAIEFSAAFWSAEATARRKVIRALVNRAEADPSAPFDAIAAELTAACDRCVAEGQAAVEEWQALTEALVRVARARAAAQGTRLARPANWDRLEDVDLVARALECCLAAVGYSTQAEMDASLPRTAPGARAATALEWMQYAVHAHGMEGWLREASGVFGADALAGAERVGAWAVARVLRAAGACFPWGAPPADQDERVAQIEALPAETRVRLARLGDELGALPAGESVTARVAAYIRAHPEEFLLP